MEFLPCVIVKWRNVSDKSGSVQDVCRGGTLSAAATAGTFRYKLIQLCTYRTFATPGLERLAGRLAWFAEAQSCATWLHQPPNCSGTAEQKPCPSVCFSVSVWRRLERKVKRRETREVVSNRAGKEGLIFYHRDVSLISLVWFLVFFLTASL